MGDVQKAFSKETTDEQFAKSYNHTKPNIKDQIILSCQSGKRSQIAAETLVNLGYKQLVRTTTFDDIILTDRNILGSKITKDLGWNGLRRMDCQNE